MFEGDESCNPFMKITTLCEDCAVIAGIDEPIE